jgi:small conductance mechanosensitive channel
METMGFSSRFAFSILGVIRTRRSIILIVTGILFIVMICALDSLLGTFFPILSFFLALPFKIIFIGAAFLLAFIIHRLAWHIAGGLLHSPLWNRVFLWSSNRLSSSRFKFEVAETGLRVERQHTIQHLVASTISVIAFVLAALLSLGQFLSPEALALFAGLFTASFSLGARPLIADIFAGVGFIFADNFDVGEKVEFAIGTGKVEGVVESMTLQTTLVRAPSGELYVVPNSDIRVLRNFSRGSHSTAHIKLKVTTADLDKALPLLSGLGSEASTLFPDLLGSWHVISETGALGAHTELTLLTKANFGQAAELRPRLLGLVQKRLTEVGIVLVD